jgi:hypothetical protein
MTRDRKSDQVANFATRSFVDDTAAKTGKSERKVQLDAERGADIDEAALRLVRGTSLDTGLSPPRPRDVRLRQIDSARPNLCRLIGQHLRGPRWPECIRQAHPKPSRDTGQGFRPADATVIKPLHKCGQRLHDQRLPLGRFQCADQRR